MRKCPFCGKVCNSLGYASHRASHFRALSKAFIPKLNTPEVKQLKRTLTKALN